jgi:hypothetical protein
MEPIGVGEGVAGDHSQRDFQKFMGLPLEPQSSPEEMGVPLSLLADLIERGEI